MNAKAITPHTVIEAAPDVLATDMGDETVLLSPQTGTYYGLNSVGQRILELVRQPRELDEVVRTLAAEYDVDRKMLEKDVLAFVQDLLKHGLVIASQEA